MKRRTALELLILLASAVGANAEEISFYNQVRPIFEQHCQICHNPQNAPSGLALTSYELVRKGGPTGPVLIPGQPEESLIVQYTSGPNPRMPKAGPPLNADQVDTIRRWIAAGARDDTLRFQKELFGGAWWSLQPLSHPTVPAQESAWVRTPIDAFILAKLKEEGLQPSPEADRRTLIRRLTYDLHGLPPAPEEVAAFLADRSANAYEKLVDRLLASPRYGERWGRHWLDVVHYGESHGYDKDKPRPNAWPYRDYVIRSLNEDKAYARFVEEQLAGDVLYPNEPEGVVATGFIAAGPWDFVGHVELREGTKDKNITRSLDRDDMVAAAMSTFVSMTAHCARCHNHKFDPISQEDYYSLQAVFAGVDRADRPFDRGEKTNQLRRALLARKRSLERDLEPLREMEAKISSPEIESLDEQVRRWREQLAALPEAGSQEQRGRLKREIEHAAAQRKELVHSLLEEKSRVRMDQLVQSLAEAAREMAALPKSQMVYAAANYFDRVANFTPAWEPRPIHLLARGNVESPGRLVGPGALSCVPGLEPRFSLPDPNDEGARRTALVKWITDPNNMLTWRSIVNRVWHYHFGVGIVDTPNDFGRMGSKPTHPELLDWLAVWFRDQGGSLKKLHKLILMSSVYRQPSSHRPEAARIDAENRYLWRMNRARLDGESVRDSALFVSGKLDLTMGGPSQQQFFFKDDHSPVYDYSRFDVDSPGSYRRSVYRFIVRSVPDPFMDRLDCPDASLLTPKRNTTITAIQALALLNNRFMVRQAELFAQRVRSMAADRQGQIAAAYRLSLGRDPSAEESRMLAG
ncbi:MAG: DUF1553 domain-containing protein, partial [Acidobacteria bacterium]|nr:DUF1553 domain-containing protein [Acidobacteriota bacterium]